MVAPLEVDVTGWIIDRLSDSLIGVRVSNKTPDKLETVLPVVRVVRTGGPDDGVILDIPTLVLHCYATTQQAANELAYRVMTALRGLLGAAADGAVMTRVRKLGGPSWNDYGNPNVAEAFLIVQARIKTA